jgi:hypothetical protein
VKCSDEIEDTYTTTTDSKWMSTALTFTALVADSIAWLSVLMNGRSVIIGSGRLSVVSGGHAW